MKILLAMDTSPASQIALEQVVAWPWPAGATFERVDHFRSCRGGEAVRG